MEARIPPAIRRALSDEAREILQLGLGDDDDAVVVPPAPAARVKEEDANTDGTSIPTVVARTPSGAEFGLDDEVVVTKGGFSFIGNVVAIGTTRWGSVSYDVLNATTGRVEASCSAYTVTERFIPAIGQAVEVKKTRYAWKWSFGTVLGADVAGDAYTIDLDDGTAPLEGVSSTAMRAAKIVPRVEIDAVPAWSATLAALRDAGGPPRPPPPAHQVEVPRRWGGGTTIEEFAPSTLVTSISGELHRGQLCTALWSTQETKLFSATITAVHDGGSSVDLLYSDGDAQVRLSLSLSLPPAPVCVARLDAFSLCRCRLQQHANMHTVHILHTTTSLSLPFVRLLARLAGGNSEVLARPPLRCTRLRRRAPRTAAPHSREFRPRQA